MDSSVSDSGSAMDSSVLDSGSPMDSSVQDSSVQDSSVQDSGLPDAGATGRDAGPGLLLGDASLRDGSTEGPDSGAAPSDALIEECEAAALHRRDLCSGTRVCLWEGYRRMCRTGNTQLLVDAMRCLHPTRCRTFSDPNRARACLERVVGGGTPASARTLLADVCVACGDPPERCTGGTAEIFPYLTDLETAAVRGCLRTCSLRSIVEECAGTVESIGGFTCI